MHATEHLVEAAERNQRGRRRLRLVPHPRLPLKVPWARRTLGEAPRLTRAVAAGAAEKPKAAKPRDIVQFVEMRGYEGQPRSMLAKARGRVEGALARV